MRTCCRQIAQSEQALVSDEVEQRPLEVPDRLLGAATIILVSWLRLANGWFLLNESLCQPPTIQSLTDLGP